MLEAYQAYGDYRSMMELTEAVVVDAVQAVSRVQSPESSEDHSGHSTLDTQLTLPWGESEIDFTPPWPRRTYADLFAEHAGCDMVDVEAVKAKAREQVQHGSIKPEFIAAMNASDMHPDVIASEVFEACVEYQLTGPIFVTDYPASLCPLTKRKADNPQVAERFELFVQGMEIANAYTELNDPDLQEQLFSSQLEGQKEDDSMARMDTDFVRSLRHGMPPAGGLGIGIDRLVMLLTDTQTIRDVILFPLLRPETR
jgi:lysyl-tRNA synthetase class 2